MLFKESRCKNKKFRVNKESTRKRILLILTEIFRLWFNLKNRKIKKKRWLKMSQKIGKMKKTITKKWKTEKKRKKETKLIKILQQSPKWTPTPELFTNNKKNNKQWPGIKILSRNNKKICFTEKKMPRPNTKNSLLTRPAHTKKSKALTQATKTMSTKKILYKPSHPQINNNNKFGLKRKKLSNSQKLKI